MEAPLLSNPALEQALLTREQPLKTQQQKTTLRIGIPKEISNEERRVALSPDGVATLVANGHEVYIETNAGIFANFSDRDYTEVGAQICHTAADVYSKASLITKVAPPSVEELDFLQEKQILLSAIHLGNTTPDFLQQLMRLRVTAIGFEFIREPDGSYPIVRMMHEITGSMAIQIAARYLESHGGGKGLLMGGISGVPPSTVVILGAGVVGEWAARAAVGIGANVCVLDTDLSALRALEYHFDRRITTAMANTQYVREAVRNADVLIGAMMSSGQRSPMLVTEDMVAAMRPGSVVVDVVIDQGGCIETSQATTHSDPVFVTHDVLHYCVPNIPSTVAQTATAALTNVLVPYVLDIGSAGSINDALWRNASMRNGTYVYHRHLTKKSLATMFGMPYRDIELLIASGI